MAEGMDIAMEEHIEDLLQNADFHNWFRVRLAMTKVSEAIKDRLLSDFSRFYTVFDADLQTLPRCCSPIDCLDNPIGTWCCGCSARVNKLARKMKRHVANWDSRCSLSRNSPENHHELLYIFLRIATGCKGNPAFDTMLNDLSCLCQVLSVCRFYDEDPHGELKMLHMKHLRDAWAHGDNGFRTPWVTSEREKLRSFSVMYELFDAQFMNPVANQYSAALRELENIDVQRAVLNAGIGNLSLQLVEFNDTMQNVQTVQNVVNDNVNTLLNENRQLATAIRRDGSNNADLIRQISDDVRVMNRTLSREPHRDTNHSKCSKNTILIVPWLIILLFCVPILLDRNFNIWWRKLKPFSYQGCPNEVNQPLNIRIRFESQGDHHLREWLFHNITRSLVDRKTSAVLLLADEGYGLTFISKQIICAYESAVAAFHLKNQLLAYHICKFNYLETQSSENMIRNFMTMMKRQLPAYDQYLYYYRDDIEKSLDRCDKDIFTCFKDVIQSPLRSITDHDQMIIVIDALDECGSCPHSVLRLIQRMLTDEYLKLPDWIKFVMTSKCHTEVTDVLLHPNIKHNKLYDFDPRHIKLLERYVLNNVGFAISTQCLDTIVNAADGSFLCLEDDLEHLQSNCDHRSSERDTSCLDRMYTNMVTRSFNTIAEFERFRPLLEVLAASFNPLYKSVYFKLASKHGIDPEYELPAAFKKMDYFMRTTSQGMVVFRHQHMKNWFTSKKRRGLAYYVSETNGHRTIAQYFLINNLNNFQNEIKPVDLARHVILSARKKLIDAFKMQFQTSLERDYRIQWEEILKGQFHRANSEALITLLLLNTKSDSLDRLAFNASVTNESTVLHTLLQLGANSRYTSDIPEIRARYRNETRLVKIDDGSWNMLQIAARYGLVPVIDILMKHDKELVYQKHEIEGNAFEIAIKYQGENVIRTMLQINRNLASMDAMLFAASEGYSTAIRVLLEFKAPNQCVDCNKTITWLDRDRFYLDSLPYKVLDSLPYKVFYLSHISSNEVYRAEFIRSIGSDIWKLTCSTPLEVAIIYGHFKVFKLLLDNNPELAHCRHYSGFTPVLTTVRYDRLKMFSYLLDKAGVTEESCKTFNYKSRNQLLRIVCADPRHKRVCELQGVLLPDWLEYCHFKNTLRDEISEFAQRGAMLDVYQRSKQNISAYMYYAVCKESSYRTLFDIAGCSKLIPYVETNEIGFNDLGICNIEDFILNQTDVICKSTDRKTVNIRFKKSVRKKLLALSGNIDDKYSVYSKGRHRADRPQFLSTLQSMIDHNNEIPRICYCNKFHEKSSEDSPNITLDMTNMYRWTVEGMTFLKMPRLFVLCQQHHIFKQVTKENPWRRQIQLYINGDVVESNGVGEIQLLELPDS